MRKPTFCICKIKGADQLRSNCEADQRLCFHYMDSTISSFKIQNFKLLAVFCACTAWFVSDMCEFSHEVVHLMLLKGLLS